MLLLTTATQTLWSVSSINLLAMLTNNPNNQLSDTFNSIFSVDITDCSPRSSVWLSGNELLVTELLVTELLVTELLVTELLVTELLVTELLVTELLVTELLVTELLVMIQYLEIKWCDLIFTILPLKCPQKRYRVKFRDYSGQNLARLKLEVEHYLNNHVQINQDVSSNKNNFSYTVFVINSNCCPIKENEMHFTRLHKPWISDAIMWYRWRSVHRIVVPSAHTNCESWKLWTKVRLR